LTAAGATFLQGGMDQFNTPAATFRMIACWAEQAAQRVETGEDARNECVFMWAAIVHGHPDARAVLKRGLDRAQLITGWPDD
jgi:pyridoxine/pyridoxamine 5'-phosphate oxidase